MRTALIVGDSGVSGDPVVEIFKKRSRSLGYDPDEERIHARALARCRSLDRNYVHLVLFCVPESLTKTDDYLSQLKDPSRRVIVYAHASCASSHVAIDYLHQGLAHGYLVNGEMRNEQSMEDLVTSLRANEPPYPAIEFKQPKDGSKPCVFVSTPFERSTLILAKRAIVYPLDLLGFTLKWGDRDFWQFVQDGIVADIRSSSLLVANVSLDPRILRDNANVYFEVGVATALGLPIIFVRRQGEQSIPLPADVQGRRWLSYDNEIDLALKLYCGLKQSIEVRGAAPVVP
jgi:hypothetical protein